MRLPIAVLIALGDRDVEIVAHLVDEPDLSSPANLRPAQASARRCAAMYAARVSSNAAVAGHLRQRVEQSLRLAGQFGGVGRGFVGDHGTQLPGSPVKEST